MDFLTSPIRYLKKKQPIYQISTLQSLIMGNYYGATTVEQLAEDIESFVDLDAATLEEIAAIHVHYPNPSH